MRILLIEDDSTLSASVTMKLRAHNCVVDATRLGEDGLEMAKIYDYDIILLDLMLPDIDGHEVLRGLRTARIRTPILVLSGTGATATGTTGAGSKIKSLSLGADDFLSKPFDLRELLARIQTIVRRSKGHSESVIRIGKLSLNIERQQVEIDGRPLRLPNKEYRVLELLCLRKGATLTKEMFLNHLYGGRDEPDHKIIDVYICKLRRKLSEATGEWSGIETVWGRGYVLRDPIEATIYR
ncbi:MAG TPA: response regulator transcription factor [Stellaceae bacterium]|nr:response regulator transcription factor [Stellaceae bacterium]